MSSVAAALVAATALGSATVGGVFFAFDAFVLRALASLEADRGASAMRAINVAAVRPALMTAVFGTAVLAMGVAVVGLRSADTAQAVLLTGGAAGYLLGGVLTTVARNVPLNNRLASAPTGAEWASYRAAWARANRLRAVGALGAATSLLAALAIDG